MTPYSHNCKVREASSKNQCLLYFPECGKCCRHHCPEQGDALGGRLLLPASMTLVTATLGSCHPHLGCERLELWLAQVSHLCAAQGTWGAPGTPGEGRGSVESADPWLAEGPCCSVTLSGSTKMFHGSDWFPSFQILQGKLQAEKRCVLMVAGSQSYASLGKTARISR